MEAEPPKADPPKRQRCWFQFSLRTLMIGVTLLAVPLGYVGRQAKIVRERKAMLENPRFTLCSHVESVNGEPRFPWARRLLGDLDCDDIYAVDDVTEEELAEYRRVFPEATVRRRREMPDGPVRYVFPDQEPKNH